MPEPAWLSYTGAITGIIGAVTGVAGAIMGYISYRHSESLKALDLRLDWISAWEADLAAVRSLEGELPDANSDYSDAKHSKLEPKLVAVHELGTRAARVRDKYLAELAADDREREHIRADMRART